MDPSPLTRVGPTRLRGRRAECGLVDRLLAGVRAGRSGALVLRGEAGVGKTALLQYAIESGADLRVLQAVGVESEMELAFAALHQLCAPMLARLERLPHPQRDALQIAFGLTSGSAPDQFLIGLAVLSLLSAVAEERPVVCVIDDVQWLDRASAHALAFVARRLQAEHVAMIFATRQGNPAFTALPEVIVEGLNTSDALELLKSVIPNPLDARVRERIVRETRGNPLALLELSGDFGTARFMEDPATRNASPVSDQIEESFRRRIEDLPEPTRQLLLVAAAEPQGDPVLLWHASAHLGLSPEAVAPAEAAGLLTVGVTVVFRHPLVRSAIYRMASPAERRRAHGALAAVTDSRTDPERRAWHRAQAADTPDEEVAGELERAADWARERGGMAAAGSLLARAVTLTPDASQRGRRALAAAVAKSSAGAPDEALALLARAEGSPLDEFQTAEVALRRAQLGFLVHRGRDSPTRLLEAARRFERLDVPLARETYLEAVVAGLIAGRFGEGARAVAEAVRRAPRAPEPMGLADLLTDGFSLILTDGYAVGAPLLKRALDAFAGPDVPASDQLRFGNFAAYAAQALWDERWATVSERLLTLGRNSGVVAILPLCLTNACGCRLHEGDLHSASALVDELDVVVEATGIHRPALGAVALAAWRGGESEMTRILEPSREAATARGEGFVLTFIDWASALLYNGLGRYAEAFEAACRAHAYPDDLWSPRWLYELVEAAARSGHAQRAATAANELGEMALVSGTDWALGVAARARALAGDDSGAESLYQEAIARLARTPAALELARAHLVYGEWLRGKGRSADARGELRIAHEVFIAAGVAAFAERARRELQAVGEKVRKPAADSRDALTAQEQQIGQLARDGLSNPEIGARLFLSPRTVEWHLRKVFAKLGVRSRRELAGALPRSTSD